MDVRSETSQFTHSEDTEQLGMEQTYSIYKANGVVSCTLLAEILKTDIGKDQTTKTLRYSEFEAGFVSGLCGRICEAPLENTLRTQPLSCSSGEAGIFVICTQAWRQ